LHRDPSSEITCDHLGPVIANPSPASILFRIALRFRQFRVIHVMAAQSAPQRRTIMTIFTIDEQNTITAFGSAEEAAAASTTPFDSFTNPKQLAELVAGWPAERLVATWNGLPGVEPVKTFKNTKTATSQIWECHPELGRSRKAEGG
jgi:hypothetical protein